MPAKSPDVVSTLGDGSELARRSTGAMLSAEKAARRDLDVVVAVATSALVDTLSSIDTSDISTAAFAAHSATRRAHGEIERGAELALASAIARGRSTAAAHAGAQFTEVDWLLRAYEIPTVPIDVLPVAEGAIDGARTASASRSLASKWLLSTTTGIRQWESAGGKTSLPQTARDGAKRISPSLDRTAATETAVAYAEEHERQMDAAVDQAKASPLQRLLYKRWEGALDRKICRVCANHDNEVVEASKSFRNDDVPGEVHPFCRCQSMAALSSTDLNVAHAVTREVAGPGLGRAAIGGRSASGAFEDWDKWPPETKKAWFKLMGQAKADPDVRARLLTPEVRRHLESLKDKVDRHAPVVPRMRKTNPKRTGRRTDARTPRAIHEEYLGRAIGAPSARFEYGELVPAGEKWKPVVPTRADVYGRPVATYEKDQWKPTLRGQVPKEPGIYETPLSKLDGVYGRADIDAKHAARTESIRKAIKDGRELPPIKVAYDPKTGLTEIVDGNHRLLVAIEGKSKDIVVEWAERVPEEVAPVAKDLRKIRTVKRKRK